MSSNIFRIAGIAGVLSAILMVVLSFANDPTGAMPIAYTLISAVLGIILVAGLYLLYRSEASGLSLAAAAIAVIGYLLFVVASAMKVTFPSPVIAAADICVYILGLALFSWLAFRTGKMPRVLAIIGFVAALAGVGSYISMSATGADLTNMASLPPVVMVFYALYLIGVIVWLAWTGIALLRLKPEAAQAQTQAPTANQPM